MTEAEAKALREQGERMAAELTETRARLARMEESSLLREAMDMASSTLASIRMPEMTRERLLGTITLDPPVIEENGARRIDRAAFVQKVKESAAGELDYLAQTTGHGSGRITGMGAAEPAAVTEADARAELEAVLSSFLGSDSLGKIAAAGRR